MTITTEKRYSNWDLTPFFPGIDTEEYRSFRDNYKAAVKQALEKVASLGRISENNLGDWADLFVEGEELYSQALHLYCFINCLSSEDVRNEDARSERSAIDAAYTEHTKLDSRIKSALKTVDDDVFEKLASLTKLDECAYKLRRLREAALKTMEVELEELAADLAVTGLSAWDRLYGQIAGTLEFELKKPGGEIQRVPMSKRNSLLENAEPAIRRATLAGSNAEWERVEDVLAACLNSISGARLALYQRRGIEHFLDAALFQSAIKRETLDALMEAMKSKREVPRRYLKLKARILGMEKLGFQDQNAPLPLKDSKPVTWADAKSRILKAFGSKYPDLEKFCAMAFEKDWIESEPRSGKRPGGYCTSSYRIGESRIFMTYNDTLGDVQTLAHELGHAFHNWIMRDLRPMKRGYPMTLAESASTFAETLLTDSLLADENTSDSEKLAIHNSNLERSVAFLLNIPMRYQFENQLYEERANGELSVSRLKELVLEAQRDCYGDSLDSEQLDPWFWASKLHFYKSSVAFYNYPYSFGYLFSMGIYARFREEGPSFLERYEDLLRRTGSDSPENIAKESLGVDLESISFWMESISAVEKELACFEDLASDLIG